MYAKPTVSSWSKTRRQVETDIDDHELSKWIEEKVRQQVAREINLDRTPVRGSQGMDPSPISPFTDDILHMSVEELIQDRLSKSKSP